MSRSGVRLARACILSTGRARRSVMRSRRTWPLCYPASMIYDLITAFLVACTAVLASEVLTRIWEILLSAGKYFFMCFS